MFLGRLAITASMIRWMLTDLFSNTEELFYVYLNLIQDFRISDARRHSFITA